MTVVADPGFSKPQPFVLTQLYPQGNPTTTTTSCASSGTARGQLRKVGAFNPTHEHTHTHAKSELCRPSQLFLLQQSSYSGASHRALLGFFPSPSPVGPSTATSGFHKLIHVIAKWERSGEEGGRACVVDQEEAWTWRHYRPLL